MTRRLTRLATGLTGAALTVLLLVGPPWLLTTFVGPPIPTSWPNLDTVREITTVGVTDTFVITTVAVVVWLAWVQLAIAIVVETVAAVRRRPAWRLPVLPGAQPLAARLVAATLLLISVLQPRPLAAAATLDLNVVTATSGVLDDQPVAAPEPPAATRPASQVPIRTIEVGERDSWWSLAETHLGDGIRWRELRDLNTDRTLVDGTTIHAGTDHLQPGWTLLVPAATSDQPGSPVTTPGEQPDDATAADGPWEVEPGDHFWQIATTTLEHAWDRAPDDHEIAPYWRTLIDINRDRLAPPGDPDLIHPGQQFELPPPPPDPTGPSSSQDRDTEPTIEPDGHHPSGPTDNRPQPRQTEPRPPAVDEHPQAHVEEPERLPGHHLADPDTEPRSHVETSPEEPQDAELSRSAEELPGDSTESGSETPAANGPGWQDAISSPSTSAPATQHGAGAEHLILDVWSRLAAGVAAAGVAGAGITALVRRRRRLALQQRPFATRLPTPAPDTLDHLHRLEQAAPDEHTTLAGLSDLLTTIPAEARPAIIILADDGTVRLLFADDHDPGQPAEPWHATDPVAGEPAGWTAQLGDHGPARSIGLPLLVTLGRADTQTILANLGSIPTLAVCGRPDAVTSALQAITLEVATSRIAGPLTLAVAGATTHPALDQAHTTDDPAAALDLARHERDQQIIDDDRTVMLLVAHPGTALPDLDDTIEDSLVGVVHAADTPPAAGWAITIHDHDTATLHLPDGGLVDLHRPDLDPAALHDELDRHDQHVPDPDAIPIDDPDGNTLQWQDDHRSAADRHPIQGTVTDLTDPATEPLPGASSNGHHPSEPAAAAPALQVCILGPVEVLRDGEPLTGLAPLTLQILVYLATHRDGVTPERLDDVIWNGQPASPKSQRLRSALTKLRDTLGPGSDGEPVLPRRRHRTDPVSLTGTVTTDLDLAVSHLEQARELNGTDRLEQLDQALAFVRGEPFAGWPLSWASEIAERAIAQLQDAAAAAAAGHRRRGQHDAAEHAILTGLKLCDPNETLYIEWARLEADRGRHDQITRIWHRLQAAYDTHADEPAGHVGTITTATATAFQQLQADAKP